jgi:hypothetical protein
MSIDLIHSQSSIDTNKIITITPSTTAQESVNTGLDTTEPVGYTKEWTVAASHMPTIKGKVSNLFHRAYINVVIKNNIASSKNTYYKIYVNDELVNSSTYDSYAVASNRYDSYTYCPTRNIQVGDTIGIKIWGGSSTNDISYVFSGFVIFPFYNLSSSLAKNISISLTYPSYETGSIIEASGTYGVLYALYNQISSLSSNCVIALAGLPSSVTYKALSTDWYFLIGGMESGYAEGDAARKYESATSATFYIPKICYISSINYSEVRVK